MKVSEKKDAMEAKYGKTIDEISQTIPADDLDIEEAVIMLLMVAFNHGDAINGLHELLAYGAELDENEVMYG